MEDELVANCSYNFDTSAPLNDLARFTSQWSEARLLPVSLET